MSGVFGYGSFGEHTRGNVLINYPTTDIFVDVAKCIMAIHVILAYPVNFYPMRRSLRIAFSPAGAAQTSEYDVAFWVRVVIAGSVVIFTAIVAIAIPRVSIIFGLLGSTAGVMIQFYLPALLVLQPVPILSILSEDLRHRLFVEREERAHYQGLPSPADVLGDHDHYLGGNVTQDGNHPTESVSSSSPDVPASIHVPTSPMLSPSAPTPFSPSYTPHYPPSDPVLEAKYRSEFWQNRPLDFHVVTEDELIELEGLDWDLKHIYNQECRNILPLYDRFMAFFLLGTGTFILVLGVVLNAMQFKALG